MYSGNKKAGIYVTYEGDKNRNKINDDHTTGIFIYSSHIPIVHMSKTYGNEPNLTFNASEINHIRCATHLISNHGKLTGKRNKGRIALKLQLLRVITR